MARILVPSDIKDQVAYSVSASVGAAPHGHFGTISNNRVDVMLLQWMFRKMHERTPKPFGSPPSIDGILGSITHYHILYTVLCANDIEAFKMLIEPIPMRDMTWSAIFNAGPMGTLNMFVNPHSLKDAIQPDMPLELQDELRSHVVKGAP